MSRHAPLGTWVPSLLPGSRCSLGRTNGEWVLPIQSVIQISYVDWSDSCTCSKYNLTTVELKVFTYQAHILSAVPVRSDPSSFLEKLFLSLIASNIFVVAALQEETFFIIEHFLS